MSLLKLSVNDFEPLKAYIGLLIKIVVKTKK